ncbi:MAG TPA: SRPBCC domain-containing protein [Candidatus Acidoferrales bacterium]|nr:SRPBCC domain-containing protein [Candidatus Acidoferrales bacterium]
MTTQIAIDAPPERVWSAFTDFDSYPQWSRFIKSISGELHAGGRLTVRLGPADSDGLTFKPRVTDYREGSVLEWLGHLVIPGIFDGRHRFELSSTGDGKTLFTQSETFGGITIPFVTSSLAGMTRSFDAFNASLKARSEGRPRSEPE